MTCSTKVNPMMEMENSTEEVDLQHPDAPMGSGVLLTEMVSLRNDLNRERWHKRGVVVVLIALALLIAFVARDFQRLNETTARLDDTVARLDQQTVELQKQRVTTIAAICSAQQSQVNAFIALQPPPRDLTQQWLEQARVDQFEKELEAQLAPLGCDLHLDPIKPPPDPDVVVVRPAGQAVESTATARSLVFPPTPVTPAAHAPATTPPSSTTTTTTTTTVPTTTTTTTVPRHKPRK